MITLSVTLLSFTGCGKNSEEIVSGTVEIMESNISSESESEESEETSSAATEESEEVSSTTTEESEETVPVTAEVDSMVGSGAGEILDAFLANKIPAFYNSEEDSSFMFSQLYQDELDYFSYSVGERLDLDNDGEDEQILDGPYGGIYLDARDGKVYVLAQGEGTAISLSYTNYDNAVWIVYSDTMHSGRQVYLLMKYDGEGNIVDEFYLSAQYWDSPEGKYDEDSEFTYRDKKISLEEYEALKKEIFGW